MSRRWRRWLMFGAVALAAVGAAAMVYGTYINPRVMAEVRANPDGVRAAEVMLLTLPDGTVLPVNYLREGPRVFAGADGRWWRAFAHGGAPTRVLIQGEWLAGHARVVADDPDYRDRVFARLRPTVPAWLPQWARAKLVVIDIAGAPIAHD